MLSPMTPRDLIAAALGLVLAVAGIGFWILVAMRGDDWLRQRVARRFGVSIGRGMRGHWEIEGGGLRGCAIEMLQLVGFMLAFVVWAIGMGIGLFVMNLISGC